MDFPDYTEVELLQIAEKMLGQRNFKLSDAGRDALARYIEARVKQPLFSNARSIRNALDRARLRQANRLVSNLDRDLTAEDLMTIDAADLLPSRVFATAAGSNRDA